MSSAAIQEQFIIIKWSTEKAIQSKEAALKLLVSARIIVLDKDKQEREFAPLIK